MGDWLEVTSDLVNQSVTFTVWPRDGSQPSSVACLAMDDYFRCFRFCWFVPPVGTFAFAASKL